MKKNMLVKKLHIASSFGLIQQLYIAIGDVKQRKYYDRGYLRLWPFIQTGKGQCLMYGGVVWHFTEVLS